MSKLDTRLEKLEISIEELNSADLKVKIEAREKLIAKHPNVLVMTEFLDQEAITPVTINGVKVAHKHHGKLPVRIAMNTDFARKRNFIQLLKQRPGANVKTPRRSNKQGKVETIKAPPAKKVETKTAKKK